MHDTEIRGGTIVDGNGQAAFTGDVVLNDGRIGQIGGKPGLAKQAIKPNGLSDAFGFHDRGHLAVGKKADVNVIDHEALRLRIPEIRCDPPMNRRRLMQRVDGYRDTFMSEVSAFKDSVHKGAKPGCLARASAP